MKQPAQNEIRALVIEAMHDANVAQKLTDAIVRATELAHEEDADRLATKVDLSELKADLKGWMIGVGLTLAGLFSGAVLTGVYFLLNYALGHPKA
jgi:hypothetical protein